MKKKKNANPVNNEVQESPLVNRVTLEILNQRHNALARYLGIPCTVPVTEVLKGAVMADATVVPSQKYACYRVDLTPFKGEFDRIRFRAVTDGENIAYGMLVDKDGNLDFIARAGNPGLAKVNIPLSAKSKTLYATMPLKKGKPAWKNLTVELLTKNGVIFEVCDAFTNIHNKIQALEARIQELTSSCETKVGISID